MDARLGKNRQTLHTDIPLTDGKAMSWLYERGEVIERLDNEINAAISVRLEPEDIARFTGKFGYTFSAVREKTKKKTATKKAPAKKAAAKKTAIKTKKTAAKTATKKKGSAA